MGVEAFSLTSPQKTPGKMLNGWPKTPRSRSDPKKSFWVISRGTEDNCQCYAETVLSEVNTVLSLVSVDSQGLICYNRR